MSTQATTEAVLRLVKRLVAHPDLNGLEWEAISVVAWRRPGIDWVHRMYGYTYLVDDVTTAKLDIIDLRPFYTQLIEATVPTGEQGWQKCLLHFDRTGRSNLQFEYEDEGRWMIDPTDMNLLPEELRPKFDDAAAVGENASPS